MRPRVVGVKEASETPAPVSVDILATTNVGVSVHEAKVDGLGIPVDVAANETDLGVLDERGFVAVLLDGMLTGYFGAVERI